MHSARAASPPPRSASTKPGRVDHVVEPELGDQPQHLAPLGAVAEITPRRSGIRSRACADAGTQRRHALLGDVAAGEHHQRLGRPRSRRLGDPAYSPSSTVGSPRTRAARSRSLVQAREAEGALGHAHAEPLHRVADPAADRRRGTRASSRGSTARTSRRPGGSARAAGRAPRRAARSRGTRRCARRRSGRRGGAGAPARRARTRAAGRIRRPPAPCRAPCAGPPRRPERPEPRRRSPVPLPQRQVGDLVAVGGQPLGQVAVPALGAPDGVRVEAVVDEADAHAGREPAETAHPSARIASFRPSGVASQARRRAESTIRHPRQLTARSRRRRTAVNVSVVIPCLNEAETIEACVARRTPRAARARAARRGVVADNGSEDRSAELAATPGRASSTSRGAATAAPTWPASPPPAASTS